MNLEFLDALKEDWEPVSRAALAGWLIFYALFLIYIAAASSPFLLIDNVNLVVHEAGHLLFGWLGQTIGVAGGTILELLVPAALAAFFIFQRQLPGTTFCSFLFFENFHYIAPYMADARRQELPLVSVGDAGGEGVHDWFYLFQKLGLLEHDTTVAALTRALGWLGMLAIVAWFIWRARRPKPASPPPNTDPTAPGAVRRT